MIRDVGDVIYNKNVVVISSRRVTYIGTTCGSGRVWKLNELVHRESGCQLLRGLDKLVSVNSRV